MTDRQLFIVNLFGETQLDMQDCSETQCIVQVAALELRWSQMVTPAHDLLVPFDVILLHSLFKSQLNQMTIPYVLC